VTIFIILAAILAAIAALLAAWPLFRPRADESGKDVRASRGVAVAIAAAVPVAAFLLYFALSDWPWDESARMARGQDPDSAASLTQVASQLEERLQREKGDSEGWKLLGRTYVMMGEFGKALSAYNQAYVLTSGTDVDAMLGYAEARVLVNESDFEGEAGQLFERALAAEPGNPKALWYAGLTAYRKQDLATARSRWLMLRDMGGPPEILQILEQRIAEIDQQIGPATGAAAGAAAQVAAAPAPAAPAASAPAPAPEPAVQQPAAGEIPLRIAVAPELAGRVPPGATLFVLARSGTGGPPLAALRRSTSELPLDVTLTDENAMIPGTSLTQVDALALVARVSMTGRPMASSGDLYGEVRYDPASKGRISLTIDKVVP
jgi:cytochrome c-type biogenesis protein CcmH